MIEIGPIFLLLLVIGLVIWRLPKVDIDHSKAFTRRRFMNWFPVGLTYAFLYMARYNLSVLKDLVDARFLSKDDFGMIFGAGTITYGLSFVINGPLTDRVGGRKTMILSATGVLVTNVIIGILVATTLTSMQNGGARPSYVYGSLMALYALNMYFQSFGAVSIVKVNSAWFHLRERGTFGGIFGVLISLGVYFAFDWGRKVGEGISRPAMFYVPAAVLGLLLIPLIFVVRDTPGEAGHADFDTGDASYATIEGETSLARVKRVGLLMLRSRSILIIACIEFFSGFLRNTIMQWYMSYAAGVGAFLKADPTKGLPTRGDFIPMHWGMMLCLAGIFGGMFAGIISDRFFQSRRGPVSAVLYGGMVLGSIALFFLVGSPLVGVIAVFMSMCIIGVHGMLSGTASMDFAGKANVGIAVGIIDGFVYLGTGLQSLILGKILPEGPAAKVAENWKSWPLTMLPAALIGFALAMLVWNAKPTRGPAAH